MRIGIFGGSFDPIHLGHLLLAETCLHVFQLNRIIFVPTGRSPHKPNQTVLRGDERAEMINLAVSGYSEYSVSRFEIESNSVCYTVETLRHFQATLLDPELYLILGADSFNDLPYWNQTAEICRLAIPIVAFRPGYTPPYFEALSQFVPQNRLALFRDHLVAMPQIDISSSQIRTRIAQGKSIRFQTPRVVESYIQTHRLYSEE
ncbi:MAG: nicotinate-nucleotide adenylyltransferase [Thermoguttaceae bacterium]